MDAPVRVDKLIENPTLAGLAVRARALDALTRALDAALPAPLAGAVAAADYRDGVLVVVARTPALATRLRFIEGSVCDELRRAGGVFADLRALRCKVARAAPDPVAPPCADTPPAHSAVGAHALEGTARALRDDGLRAAVRRLADHLAGKTPASE